ncbi:MAG: FkbM family methyltransferase [Sphingomonadales bacterium]|nr:FkbM family methyltransferase [Sphingomonadales bacterium]MDE2567946.1 FkbM family methyltransferase [Sphingomonadales bacterium]
MLNKVCKAFIALTSSVARKGLRHGVAPAIEHREAIALVKPAALVDVGANKGQFSIAVRSACPGARIIAFEPLDSEAARFNAVFGDDPLVELHRNAIAETEGTAEFHVADRADSSSLLEIDKGQADAFGVREASTVTVQLRPLSACVDFAALPRPVMLKIDVQGAELMVLRSIADWSAIDFVYVELSFVELYRGQPCAGEVIAFLRSRNFEPGGVFNQVSTGAFGPTQADFLFRPAAAG